MSLPDQLRVIADRIEAAEAERRAAIAQLTEFAGGAYNIIDELGVALDADVAEVMRDGSSIEPIDAPVSRPAAQAAGVIPTDGPSQASAGTLSPPSLSPNGARFDLLTCPECGRQFKRQGFMPHRIRIHGVVSPAKPSRSPAERLAARDASRAKPKGPKYAPAAGVTRPSVVAPPSVLRKGGESFLCGRCPMTFTSREKLDNHLVVDHPDTEPRRLVVGQGPARSDNEAAQRMFRGGSRRVSVAA